MQPVDHLIARAIERGRSGHVRQAAHMLRERLVRDPSNAPLRRAIAEVYRDGGHPDQAARYMFAFGSYDAATAEPYLQWLAATGADEQRIRHLSALPADAGIPQPALDRLEHIRTVRRAPESWEAVSLLGVVLFVVLALITSAAVCVVVILGENLGRSGRPGRRE